MIKKIANSITNSVVSGWQKLPKKRILTFVGMFLFCAVATFAQSKGAGGFSTAIKEVSSYEEPVGNLMKAIAAVIALVGSFSIYFKMRAATKTSRRLSCSPSVAVSLSLQ